MSKFDPPKKAARARSAVADQERAARLGLPLFLVRLAGWQRLKVLSAPTAVRHHCD